MRDVKRPCAEREVQAKEKHETAEKRSNREREREICRRVAVLWLTGDLRERKEL